MEEQEFLVLTGESYTVRATNEEEALKKMYLYLDGNDCDCDKAQCDCVEYSETRTEVI